MSTDIKPCSKCGSTDITVWDCGYSSFNVGGAKCKCGNESRLVNCGCYPQEEIISHWNLCNPSAQEAVEIKKKEISNLKKQIADKKKEIRALIKKIKGA